MFIGWLPWSDNSALPAGLAVADVVSATDMCKRIELPVEDFVSEVIDSRPE